MGDQVHQDFESEFLDLLQQMTILFFLFVVVTGILTQNILRNRHDIIIWIGWITG